MWFLCWKPGIFEHCADAVDRSSHSVLPGRTLVQEQDFRTKGDWIFFNNKKRKSHPRVAYALGHLL